LVFADQAASASQSLGVRGGTGNAPVNVPNAMMGRESIGTAASARRRLRLRLLASVEGGKKMRCGFVSVGRANLPICRV
jgi:hypothetical protein